jgi:hypothetical protein
VDVSDISLTTDYVCRHCDATDECLAAPCNGLMDRLTLLRKQKERIEREIKELLCGD